MIDNPFFASHDEMLSEADMLIREDQPDSEDRAVISSFYNGRQTMTDAEAENQGVTELTNHLFGYDSMVTAKTQIESIFIKPPQVWSFKLPGVPIQVRQKWELSLNRNFNEVIKNSGRMKPEIKTLAGDLTLFGNACPMYRDQRDWCPKVMRPLVPRGTGTVAPAVEYAVVPSYLSLGDLMRAYERVKRLRKSGTKYDWQGDALSAAIDTLKGNINLGTSIITNARQPADEVQQNFQETKRWYAQYRTRLPVYYVYTSHPDRKGTPADLTILARYSPTQINEAGKASMSLPVCLYERSEIFDRANQWICPMFIDASLDGEMTWHRVMGLGRLNYDSDVDVEQFFNDAMTGSRENLRRTYKVASQGDWELVQRWNNGEFASNVLPPGVDLAEAAKNPNFQYAQQTLAMLRAASAKNAGSSSGAFEQRDNELQVQALERQSRNAETMGTRISDVYDGFDSMGTESFRRMCATLPLPVDPGYEEVMEFQDRIRRDGVPVEILRQLLDDGPQSISVYTNRTVGDGNKVRAIMVNQMLMQRISYFSPEAQQLILRRVTADDTQDYQLAEQLVPYEPKPDPNQVERANGENDSCMLRGITGYVPPHNQDDLDAVHLVEHFGGMQALLAKGNAQKGWDMMDATAFKAMGSHCALHISIIQKNPEAKGMATALMQQLQGLARQGQEFLNNLQQQAQKQEVDPVEQAKMQIQQQKLQLDTRKQVALEDHRKAVLALNTRKAGSGEVMAAAQLINAEKTRQHNEHMDRIDAAQKHLDYAHSILEGRGDLAMQIASLQQDQQQFDQQQVFQRQQAEADRAAASVEPAPTP